MKPEDMSVEELIQEYDVFSTNFLLAGTDGKDRNEIRTEILSRFTAQAAEIENLKWWREHGQKLRNAIADNITDKCGDDDLINAPSEIRKEITRLKAENDDLKCCGNCNFTNGINDFCEKYLKQTQQFKVCSTWQSDSLTKKERKG